MEATTPGAVNKDEECNFRHPEGCYYYDRYHECNSGDWHRFLHPLGPRSKRLEDDKNWNVRDTRSRDRRNDNEWSHINKRENNVRQSWTRRNMPKDK